MKVNLLHGFLLLADLLVRYQAVSGALLISKVCSALIFSGHAVQQDPLSPHTVTS